MKKCGSLKANGQPCRAFVMKGTDVCAFHASDDDFNKTNAAKRDEPFDVVLELKKQFTAVKRLPASIEKSKLLLEITKLLKDCDGKPASAASETERKPTPREILLGKQ